MMLSLEQALPIADDVLQKAKADGSPVMITRAILDEVGWVFNFNSVKFMETRNWHYLLGGNAPILVRHDGSSTHLPLLWKAGDSTEPA